MKTTYQPECAIDKEELGFRDQPPAYVMDNRWLCPKHLHRATSHPDSTISTRCPRCNLVFRGSFGLFIHISRMHKDDTTATLKEMAERLDQI